MYACPTNLGLHLWVLNHHLPLDCPQTWMAVMDWDLGNCMLGPWEISLWWLRTISQHNLDILAIRVLTLLFPWCSGSTHSSWGLPVHSKPEWLFCHQDHLRVNNICSAVSTFEALCLLCHDSWACHCPCPLLVGLPCRPSTLSFPHSWKLLLNILKIFLLIFRKTLSLSYWLVPFPIDCC